MVDPGGGFPDRVGLAMRNIRGLPHQRDFGCKILILGCTGIPCEEVALSILREIFFVLFFFLHGLCDLLLGLVR